MGSVKKATVNNPGANNPAKKVASKPAESKSKLKSLSTLASQKKQKTEKLESSIETKKISKPKSEPSKKTIRPAEKLNSTDLHYVLNNRAPEIAPYLNQLRKKEGNPAEVISQINKLSKKLGSMDQMLVHAAVFHNIESGSKGVEDRIKFEQIDLFKQSEAAYHARIAKNRYNDADFNAFMMSILSDDYDSGMEASSLSADIAKGMHDAILRQNKRTKERNNKAWEKASKWDRFFYLSKDKEQTKRHIKSIKQGSKMISAAVQHYKISLSHRKYKEVEKQYLAAKTPAEKKKALEAAYKFAKELDNKNSSPEKIRAEVKTFFEGVEKEKRSKSST